MIKSFGSHKTEKVWNGVKSKKLPVKIQKTGRRKLRMINNLSDANDLMILTETRSEKLSGKLKESFNIRIKDQWSVVFKWMNGHAYEVKITDQLK